MAFKVPPFQDCVLSFLGFSEEEKSNMEERTLKHGTEESSLKSPSAAAAEKLQSIVLSQDSESAPPPFI